MVSELLLKWKLNWICSNLNRIVVLFNPCNMNEILLEVFFQTNSKVVSKDTNYMENMERF